VALTESVRSTEYPSSCNAVFSDLALSSAGFLLWPIAVAQQF